MKKNVWQMPKSSPYFAKKFGIGQWSFIGPGSEKKWYSAETSPQGAWDHIAEEMLLEFAESGVTNVIPTNIEHIPSNTMHSGASAMLYVFEDNEAVIKMMIKGRSPTIRHDSRTHRVALLWIGCLTESIWTPKSKSNTLTPKTNSQTY